MDTSELLDGIKKEMRRAESTGTKTITISALILYFDRLDEALLSGNSTDSRPQVTDHEPFLLEEYKGAQAAQLESMRAVTSAGQSALRASFLVNGGATVALLAFLGKLSDLHAEMVPIFASSMILFVFGTLSVVVASGITYITEWFRNNNESRSQKIADFTNVISIIFVLTSYSLFICGALRSYWAFLAFGV